MPSTPATLSVALITLNEEANLARTLESIAWADEIVVVDAGSADRTLEVARFYNARVHTRAWSGFAAQKNFALAQCTGDWVLSLDADEELSPELQSEVQALLASTPAHDAYKLRRRNLFLGRWVRHGGFYPDAKLRLFRRSSTMPQFEVRPVHETITPTASTGVLQNDLIHHAYPTLSAYIEHMDRYSTLGAEVLVARGRTSRNPIAFVWNILYAPALTWQWNYFARLGFLDGREGLLLHWYHAAYTSWKYAKAWEATRSAGRE